MSETPDQILRHELAEAVGAEAADRALAEDDRAPARHGGLVATLWSNRLLIAVLLVVAIIVGAFLSVLTGSWFLMGWPPTRS